MTLTAFDTLSHAGKALSTTYKDKHSYDKHYKRYYIFQLVSINPIPLSTQAIASVNEPLIYMH